MILSKQMPNLHSHSSSSKSTPMLTFGNKYSYLILLCVGFVLGLYFSSLFSGCGRQASPVPAVTFVKPEVIQKQAAAAEAGYQVKIDSLGAAAKNLQVALQTSQSALDKAKKKNIALQTQVYDLLDRSAAAPTDTARPRPAARPERR